MSIDAPDEGLEPGIPSGQVPPAPGRLPWIVLWLPALLSVLMGLPTLVYPFGRDQGNYAYSGWVILEGGAPYADVFIFKPPATSIVHTVALALFGVNMTAIRLLDLGWTALTAVAVAIIAHRLLGRKDVALWSGALVPLLYVQFDYWNIAQTDGWLNLPCAVAILGVLLGAELWSRRRPGALGLWLVAGIAAGIAVTFKYTAGLIGLPMLVAMAYGAVHRGRGIWWAFPMVVVGGVLPLAGMWAWLVGMGGWEAFLDVQLELVPTYVRKTAKARTVGTALSKLISFNAHKVDVGTLWWAGAGAWIPAVIRSVVEGRRGLLALAVIGAWWGVGVASVLTQGKYYDYHYLPLLAPTALLGGLALSLLVSWIGGFTYRAVRIPLAGVVLAGAYALLPSGELAMEAAEIAVGARTWSDYLAKERRFNYRDYDLEDQERLVAHLRQTTQPDDHVFIWGFDPAIHIWAQRRGTTRFLYNYPFRVSWGNTAYETELMQGLQAEPPEVFVVAKGDATPGVTGSRKDSRRLLSELAPLKAFVAEHYAREQEVGRYMVYRKRGQDDRGKR